MEKVNYKPVTNVISEKFIKGFKFLTLDPKYKDLTTKAKVLYMFIADKKDRDERYNKTKADKDGQVYIEYLLKDMANDLGCHKNSVAQYKAELVNKGLISIPNKKGTHAIYVNEHVAVTKSVRNAIVYTDKETNQDKYTYFEVPTFLLHEHYKNLSWEAILIYALIKDRFLLSINSTQNGNKMYVDNYNHIFAYLAYSELTAMINKNEKTVAKHKRQLIAHNLLHEANEVRESATGTQTTHIRYYVFEPIALPVVKKERKQNEIVKVTNEMPESDNIIWNDEANTSDDPTNHKEEKTAITKKEADQSQYLQGSKTLSDTSPINTSSNAYEMNYVESIESHLSQHKHANTFETEDEVEQRIKARKLKNYPEHLASYLRNYTVEDISTLCGIICNAKNIFNKHTQTDYRLEDVDLEHAIVSKLKHLRDKNREKQESVGQRAGYIQTAFQNMFIEFHEQKEEQLISELYSGPTVDFEKMDRLNQEMFEKLPLQRQCM